jgi:hypothetical protein
MNCASCNNSNPDSNRFCGTCGAPLDPALQRMSEELDRRVSEKIAAAMAGWKESKLVELETTDAIQNRLQERAKRFGFFVGIPLTLISIWLGMLGFESYEKLRDLPTELGAVKKNADDLQGRVTAAKVQMEIAQRDLDGFRSSLSENEKLLDVAKQEIPEIQSLRSEVTRISESIATIAPSKETSRKRVDDIQSLLKRYYAYLKRLGVPLPDRGPQVKIEEKDHLPVTGNDGAVIVGKEQPGEGSDILWAYGNANLPPQGEGEEGFIRGVAAHYFASDFLNEAPRANYCGSALHPSYDWVAFSWDIRTKIGRPATDRLLVAALLGAKQGQPNSNADEYFESLIRVGAGQSDGGRIRNMIDQMLSSKLPTCP